MKPNQILYGHVLDAMKQIPDKSVHCGVTSPPYWGLRDYGIEPVIWDGVDGCEHEWGSEQIANNSGGGWNDPEKRYLYPTMRLKSPEKENKKQVSQGNFCGKCGAWRGCLGLEPSPELFIKHMVDIFREFGRILRDDGTLWLNLGDNYVDKNMVGGPWRVALALQAEGWLLRSDIIWHKRNVMPESAEDRPTKSHEYLFLLTKEKDYFYDGFAIREKVSGGAHAQGNGYGDKIAEPGNAIRANTSFQQATLNRTKDDLPTDRNKRTVWSISSQAYPGAHFATFPPDLIIPAVKAGTSEKGCCSKCGAQWKRIVEKSGGSIGQSWNNHEDDLVEGQRVSMKEAKGGNGYKVETIGWKPTCTHEADVVPCVVFDPFMGSGTTAMVAKRLDRSYLGIEANLAYKPLIDQRLSEALGPLFTEDDAPED